MLAWLFLWLNILSFLACTQCINVSVNSEICLGYNLAHQLPIWNSTEGDLFQSVPYVGAVFPADALSAPIPAGGRIVVVLYRMRSSKHIACGESAAVASEEVLRSVLEYTSSSPDAHWTPSRQQRSMFGRVSVEGRVSNSAYYHLIRPRPEFVHEWHPKSALDISSTDEDLDFYWFELTPPLPATYSLTLHVDFADCRGPLSELSSPYFVNASALDDYCKLVYGPAMRMSVTVSTEKYSVPLPTAWCELHAMEGGYWVYPAASRTTAAKDVYNNLAPVWHAPSCLTLEKKMKKIIRTPILMIGDSNTKRTCNWFLKPLGRTCAMHDKYTSFLSKKFYNHNLARFNTAVRGCYGPMSFQCALNIGHHMSDLSPTDMASNHLEVVLKDVIHGNITRKSETRKAILVWSTLASHSKYLPKDKFGKYLHLMSNYYREAWQNQEIKRLVNEYCIASNPRTCVYVDLFSPTLALSDISHIQDDPVHFSHGLYYNMFHDFISKMLSVAESCSKSSCLKKTPAETPYNGFFSSVITQQPDPTLCVHSSAMKCSTAPLPMSLSIDPKVKNHNHKPKRKPQEIKIKVSVIKTNVNKTSADKKRQHPGYLKGQKKNQKITRKADYF